MHRGPYSEIGDTFKKFFATINDGKSDEKQEPSNGFSGANSMDGKVLGLYLDNPENTAPENLRSYAAMEIGEDAFVTKDLPNDWEKIESLGGPAAVLTVNGSYSQLVSAWQGLGKRVVDEGWKISTNPAHIVQEVYVTMDMEDETKNVTKLIVFLDE
jgi:DNA gyrase inhibitor GyrI